MPKPNQQTARGAQEAELSISVDLNESDPAKAVQRNLRPKSDIAAAVNDREEGTSRRAANWADKNSEVNKRLERQARSLTRTFEQRLADQQAEHQRQLSDMRQEVDKLKLDRGGDAQAAADAAHEQAIAALRTKLEAAVEAGNSSEQAKIGVEIARLEGQYWAKKATAAGVTTRTEGTAEQRQERRPAARTTGPTVAGSRFIQANEDWWDDPDYKVEKGAAGTIYADLVRSVAEGGEGMDANSDETFAEVGRQLKEKFPDLDIKGVKSRRRQVGDDEELENESGRRAPVGSVQDRGEGGANNRSARTVLTQADIATMRKSDLNPENNLHVLQFMREKQAYEATEA